ncbi:MAG: hypothetical protein KF787_09980 [Phycisphaeraceae bacterium]|nr:hypothetical protein [Phycisphaerae bacterium]MBX3392962.1 hypothetical protein [Phycisphaeraceae bacterium]HRJ49495.1 hypothetical protein [Phycisphaerales bacterium]
MKISFFWGAGAALCVCTSSFAQAGGPFQGVLTPTQRAEIAAWRAAYLHRVESGDPAAGAAGFAFSDPALNTPLFSPLSAAVRTVAAATGAESIGCSTDMNLSSGWVQSGTLAWNIRLYLATEEIQTHTLEDVEASIAHLNAITSAGGGVWAWIEEGVLGSSGLPASTISGHAGPAVPIEPDELDLHWIASLVQHAPGLAATIDHAEAARAPLTGQPPIGARIRDLIESHLSTLEIDGPMNSDVVEAWFGAYGSLPIVVTSSLRCFVLTDALTGDVYGPYQPGTPIDASSLLAGHPEYVTGSGIAVMQVDEAGCVIGAPIARKWTTVPPCSTPGCLIPRTPCPPCKRYTPPYKAPPGLPGLPPHPPYEPSVPGWSNMSCNGPTAAGTCICLGVSQSVTNDEPSRLILIEDQCVCTPSSAGDCPSSLSGCTCTTYYYY